MTTSVDTVIVGAGISGLAAAYWLQQKGHTVRLLEKEPRVGGSIQTTRRDGFIIEHGPNSGLETNPVIGKLVDALGLRDDLLYASEEANNRYIVRDDRLHPLPMSPPKFLKTELFSTRAKFRVLKELFVSPPEDGTQETVAEFVTRRLGPEFLRYAINPFVAGVFAGDPGELSVRAAFPKLVALEDNYGGIFKGVIKGRRERKKRASEGEESKQSARMFSFGNGLGSLTEALEQQLADHIVTEALDISVTPDADAWQVTYRRREEHTLRAATVLFATPAYATSDLIRDLDNETAAALNAIPYAKAVMVFTGYKQQDVPRPLDGFGYLIPEAEQLNTLGTIWSSSIFPNRAPEGSVAFTTFMGGRRQPGKLDLEESALLEEMQEDFRQLMGITAEPETVFIRKWPKAIPQYTLGHLERENRMDTFERTHPGLFITGNHRGGISVADCIKHSEPRAEHVDQYLHSVRAAAAAS